GNKDAKIMNIDRINGMGLRRSPRLCSAPPETKGCSSKTIFKSSENGSYSETRPSGTDKEAVLSKRNDPNFSDEKQRRKSPRFVAGTEHCGGNGSLRKFQDLNSRLSIEAQLRRSLKISQATKNGCPDVSITRLDMDERGSSGEKRLGLSASSVHATENGDSNASFREHRREMSDEKQLKTPSSLSTLLAEGDGAEINSSSNRLSNSYETFSKKAKGSSLSGKKRTQYHELPSARSSLILIRIPCILKLKRIFSYLESTRELKPRKLGHNSLMFQNAKHIQHLNDVCYLFGIKNQAIQVGQNIKSNRKDKSLEQDSLECGMPLSQAEIDGCTINLGDCIYIKGEEAKHHIGRILEFFKTTDGENYLSPVVMKQEAALHDERRLCYSTLVNENLIDCIISKVSVTQISPKFGSKSNSLPRSDFYFDMESCVDYSTFCTLPTDNSFKSHNSSKCYKEVFPTTPAFSANIPSFETYKAQLTQLDLYSGCGGMSTGLCLRAKALCNDLVAKWAADSDKSACESLKLSHPEAHVRNEAADDFLQLLKEWEKLCKQYRVKNLERTYPSRSKISETVWNNASSAKGSDTPPDEHEVSSLVDICYGDPCNTGNHGLKSAGRVYTASDDTWEPIEGLRLLFTYCIQEFVTNGFRSKILPLRGDVDVICGGPPCQEISGYNRHRNVDSSLDDEKNRQIVVFMDIVEYLKPKFVLMENVVDMLRLDKASLGRYTLSRLVLMKYQARLGIVAAGCYGLPQFQLRVFLFGAHSSEKLPQIPLPTHDVIVRYGYPAEFERNTVAYDEGQPRQPEDALVLRDYFSDLPPVANNEAREKMTYEKPPETDFQRYIRSSEYNLPGVIVGTNNVARRDRTQEQQFLPSGKPLVPDYVFTLKQGKSKRPFARLWWDETMPTVLTAPFCHSQVSLCTKQDRLLTVREWARLQGFPDYYRFRGTIKERYCQIGNAVAIPVGRALGYTMGMAFQKGSGMNH
ncbi:hypothetical protein ES288_A08G178200v1, partial [Gossypium darwinii]